MTTRCGLRVKRRSILRPLTFWKCSTAGDKTVSCPMTIMTDSPWRQHLLNMSISYDNMRTIWEMRPSKRRNWLSLSANSNNCAKRIGEGWKRSCQSTTKWNQQSIIWPWPCTRANLRMKAWKNKSGTWRKWTSNILPNWMSSTPKTISYTTSSTKCSMKLNNCMGKITNYNRKS